jgi:mannose-6-phosphate isomerase-like protein (cupin superfamily)
MPVFQSGEGLAPDWCEMQFFEIVELRAGASHDFPWIGPKEKLIVADGRCRIGHGARELDGEPRTRLDRLQARDPLRVLDAIEPSVLVRVCGDWGEELGGFGLFVAGKGDGRTDRGDPVDYAKDTRFDNHYHDCDEYWIFYRGRCTAVSEGIAYEVAPGDCVATGMGHHHDIPLVHEPIAAVYFETTMRRAKRRRHLWNHTDGPAKPDPVRV